MPADIDVPHPDAPHSGSTVRQEPPPPASPEDLVHLRAAGVSVLLDFSDQRLPFVRHWGADLGDLTPEAAADTVLAGRPAFWDSFFDVANDITVVPEHASAWMGRAGLEGSRQGRNWSTAFRTTGREVTATESGGQRVTVSATDEVAALSLELEIELLASGLLRLRGVLGNNGSDPYQVGALRFALPVPAQADQLLDFTGRGTRERQPQRRAFTVGLHSREVHTGRTGLDAATLLMAGETGFGFRSGEVWGVHLGWSGNQNVYAERLSNGARLLAGGELLEHGELILASGERYASPWLYASYGTGLDAVAGRIHQFLRSRAQHPRRPRPVILNTWEAVYFDQDLDALKALADRGAEVGAERFVLDDGWFGGRRNDRSSLGDWYVSSQVWPDGLSPIVDHVRGLGLEFGLWVEPEMINLDSDLARRHPEWILQTGGRIGLPSRYQHVLDLGHPEAYDYIHQRLNALLGEYDIAYLKWDHNRNLGDAGHMPGGEPGIHRHTLAFYRLLDDLRSSHPGVEIESCAGGGGRIDLGVIQRTDRVWASDCIDALERQQIQRYTQMLLPPELIGTHTGSPTAHTTGRTHDLSFRAATAIWGHMGIEWDLTRASAAERAELAAWVAFHKRMRPLLHSGTVVNADHPDPAFWAYGVVAQDRREALFHVVAHNRSVTWPPGRVRLPGLDPDTTYAVSVPEISPRPHHGPPTPEWVHAGLRLPGRVLERVGVEIVPVNPEHSYLLHLTAT